MMDIEAAPGEGKFVANVMHFARALRAAGLPIGPGTVIDGLRAVETVGVGNREDFYWALHAVFVNRRDQREMFDQAFHVFWRNPRILERMMALILPDLGMDEAAKEEELSRRLAEALRGDGEAEAEREPEPEVEIDAAMTYSSREQLQARDFEKMSAEEVALAKEAMARMRLPAMAVPTRRFRPSVHGRRIDMRATLRASLRSGSRDIPLKRRERQRRHPPLVILCDISGSMSRYSRMLVHFLHAVTNDRARVHTFLFGTRLREFNTWWSRRVLGQGAVVLLITDGLDREGGEGLRAEMERLHKSCRRLVWLNPLLRYEEFEPKSMGMRAIMPHVDDFRPVHNLDSLSALADALARAGPGSREEVKRWLEGMG